MGCLQIKEAMFANCILFATFLFRWYPCSKEENMKLQCPESYGFGLQMTDIPDYVSWKFKMYIFKIALVISENVPIAFLYVLSIFSWLWVRTPVKHCFSFFSILE